MHERIKESISWDEAKAYVVNIYDKINRGIPLEQYEEQILQTFPRELIDEVNREEAGKAPLKRLQQLREQGVAAEQFLAPDYYQKLTQASPEAMLINTFMPEIFDADSLFNVSSSKGRHKYVDDPNKFIDASINVIAYLRAMGYMSGMWMLGPEHNATGEKRPQDHCSPLINGVIPVCDYLNASTINFDEAIQRAHAHATQHGYYPPKVILSHSHPGCSCSILCWAPATPEEIPDSAPGIPMAGTAEEILYYKQFVHKKLKDVQINRWTYVTPEIYGLDPTRAGFLHENALLTSASFEGERLRFANSEWKEDIKPVIIQEGFILISGPGLYTPVPDTYVGLKIGQNEENCKVYIGYLGRVVIVPIKKIQEITIKSVDISEASGNMYIKVDDTLCMIIKVLSENKILCYNPELDARITVDSGEVFESDE